MRIIRNAAFVCCLGATAALPWFQSDKQPARPLYIELTKVDLFSVKDWTSAQVQIAGLRLGMTRDEANEAVRKEGFRLVQDGIQPGINPLPCSNARFCYLDEAIVGIRQNRGDSRDQVVLLMLQTEETSYAN